MQKCFGLTGLVTIIGNRSLGLVLLLMWLWLPAAMATPGVDNVPDSRHFVVAVGNDSSPYQFTNESGDADGLIVDIWRMWAQKNGYTLEFRATSWRDSMAAVDNREVDFSRRSGDSPSLGCGRI